MKEQKRYELLETIYQTYNRRRFVYPDPLHFLYRYRDVRDREVAGIVASSLAYGRVAQLVNSIEVVLEKLGPCPAAFISSASSRSLHRLFAGFRHRFTTGRDISELLCALKHILKRYGSVHACFTAGIDSTACSTFWALQTFVSTLREHAPGLDGHVLPVPERGSACKRLHLFLRWMVRCDEVDPGGWEDLSPVILVVPVDVHMHRIGRALGFTTRTQADFKTALEITEGFRRYCPHDPVRYDFALTRYGIRTDMDMQTMLTTMRKT